MDNTEAHRVGQPSVAPALRRNATHVSRRTLLGFAGASAVAPPSFAQSPGYPAPDRELMVPVRGGQIYVRTNGPLNGPHPPLVVVHGGPGSTHGSYLELLPLINERGLILYDQLDSGRSDRPNDPVNWTVDRFVDELETIRAALGVPRWHVMGHSWGGTIALEYGARRPDALAGLCLASPLISTSRWLGDTSALRGTLPAEVQAELAACETPAPPPGDRCSAAETAFLSRFGRRRPDPEALTAYRRDPRNRGFNPDLSRTMWGASEFTATGTLSTYDGEPLLAKLDGSRTLFLVGQYDEARPVTAALFAERVPDAEFAVVPGAAHSLHIDRPEETVAVLRAWLRRQDRL